MSDNKTNPFDLPRNWQRRDFVTTLLKAAVAAPLMTIPGAVMANDLSYNTKSLTVQQVIDLILTSIPNAPFKETVDTIKSGDPSQTVSGIVTTMFATNAVIEKTIRAGANFIIAHEPTFYNHLDEVAWLNNDPVYLHKKDMLEKNKIVVWRFHDYIHAHKPDGILMGVLTALGWWKYYNADKPNVINLPAISLGQVINHVKARLEIAHVKVMGNITQTCKRIAIIPGAVGGMSQIGLLQKEKPDVLICGEINEWKTSEYIRDMRQMGFETALIVTGHSVSEEPGLQWLVEWLQPQLPGLKITHIPSHDSFSWA